MVSGFDIRIYMLQLRTNLLGYDIGLGYGIGLGYDIGLGYGIVYVVIVPPTVL